MPVVVAYTLVLFTSYFTGMMDGRLLTGRVRPSLPLTIASVTRAARRGMLRLLPPPTHCLTTTAARLQRAIWWLLTGIACAVPLSAAVMAPGSTRAGRANAYCPAGAPLRRAC
jgi:hypothetical protein